MAEGVARNANDRSFTMLASVAGDVHFWVPTIVLIGGLFLLRWAN
jgi:hypothetical protein